MDREAQRVTVHRVAKSQTQLKQFRTKDFSHRKCSSLSVGEGFSPVEKHADCDGNIFIPMRWRKFMKSIYQTLNGPLGTLKYLEAVQSLPWGVLWITRTIEVGTFYSVVNVSLTIFIHHLSIDHWFGVCTVMRSGFFRVSDRTELFDINHTFLFFPKIVKFPILFFLLLNLILGLLEPVFSKVSFEEISLWIMAEVCLLLVPIRIAFHAEISAR